MADLFPARLKGGRISVLVGNGANPEVFVKLCGATSRAFTVQKNTTDDNLDNCGDPDAIPARVLQVTGEGNATYATGTLAIQSDGPFSFVPVTAGA